MAPDFASFDRDSDLNLLDLDLDDLKDLDTFEALLFGGPGVI